MQGVGSQALHPVFDTEDEIDAVAGLTAAGGGVGVPAVPEPETYALMLAGLAAIGLVSNDVAALRPILIKRSLPRPTRQRGGA